MRVVVNGEAVEVDPATVASLVEQRGTPWVAVARNGVFVPRSRWAETALTDGDTVELLVPMAGG